MQSVYAMVDPFDRGNGNGSRTAGDDWLDTESIFHNEWGSTAATTFNADEADADDKPIPPDKKRRLERQYNLHNGKGEEDRKDTIRSSYVVNDAKLFMSVLELPSPQRDSVLEVLDNLDISSNNFGGTRRYEKIILAICSLISDEFLSNQPNPSIDARIYNSDRFRDLMDVCGMTTSEHRQLRVSVREKSEYFD